MLPGLGISLLDDALAFQMREHRDIVAACVEGTPLAEQRRDLVRAVNRIDLENVFPERRAYDARHHCDRGEPGAHDEAWRACHAEFEHLWSSSRDLGEIALWMHAQADFFAHSTWVDLPADARAAFDACWTGGQPCAPPPGLLRLTGFFVGEGARERERADDWRHDEHALHAGLIGRFESPDAWARIDGVTKRDLARAAALSACRRAVEGLTGTRAKVRPERRRHRRRHGRRRHRGARQRHRPARWQRRPRGCRRHRRRRA